MGDCGWLISLTFKCDFAKSYFHKDLGSISLQTLRGISSVGRAFEWHSKGQGFESPILHHTTKGLTTN